MCMNCDAIQNRLATSHRVLNAMKDDLDEAQKVAHLASTKESNRLLAENTRLKEELSAQERVILLLNKKLIQAEARKSA